MTWKYTTPGIPDNLFERGRVPMTKEEIRAVTMSKARITRDSVVYDIGAGTGSITVEAALLAREGKVYAIERKDEAMDLIKRNAQKFGLTNVEVIAGEAPEAILGLPPADRIIIGGSGGRIEDILDASAEKLKGDGIIVVNTVLVDSFQRVLNHVPEGFSTDITQVQVNRMDERGMMKALNPVTIITLTRSKE